MPKTSAKRSRSAQNTETPRDPAQQTSVRPAVDFRLTGLMGSLRSGPLFAGLPAEDLMAIASFARSVSLSKGEYLFHEGEPSRGFYVVQSGSINVHRVNPAWKEQVIHIFRAGESFAEDGLASPTGYPADARAIEASTVLLIPKEPILGLIAQRPDLAMRMLGAMSAHLRVLVGALEDLTLKDVETRLLNWLVKQRRGLASRDLAGKKSGSIQLPGTKRALAAELGTSSETLSRTLAKLRAEKLISVAARSINILDADRLEALLRRHLGETNQVTPR